MFQKSDFTNSLDTNPSRFKHYDINDFSLFVKGKHFHNEGLSLCMDHEKPSVMSYRTLFEASSIHHSNLGLHKTYDMYINGYFMLLSVLTHYCGASEDHISHPENGNISIKLKFNKPLTEAITCLLYLEFDKSFFINFSFNVTTEF